MGRRMPKFRRMLDAFENATRNHEIKGSMPPEEIYDIEEEYETAKEAIIDYFAEVEKTLEERK